MSNDLILVLILLAGSIVMLIANKPRMDVVALLMLILLPVLGLATLPEALAGFSDPNVILIGALFVIGEGLVRTGIAYRLGDFLVYRAARNEKLLLALLMASVTGLGAFMSSTGVVAIFIPVVLRIAGQLGVSPGRLMMPLSFAGLISGMQTLVATPPNMVLDGALERAGLPGFGFFSFTPIGILVLIAGIAYMLLARRWLAKNDNGKELTRPRRSIRDLIDEYHLREHGHALRVRPTSPLVGHTLRYLGLRDDYHVNVVGIQRHGKYQNELLNPNAHTQLRASDMLLVDMSGAPSGPATFAEENDLDVLEMRAEILTDHTMEVGMAEAMLPPDSALLGKTVRETAFRTTYGLNVIGLRRGGSPLEGRFLEEKLKAGDMLLLFGPWKSIRHLQTQIRDFVVLSLPLEADIAAPAAGQAPLAVAALLIMVVLMVSGLVPNVLAALIGCMLMGLFRCIDMESAYRSIHWQSLILIIGMMPFATALQKTGGIDLLVDWLMGVVGDAGPRTYLASLFALTSITGLFISNTATAVLLAPVALQIAATIGCSPRPLAMTVAVAASAAFMTPVSSPVNTLVLVPGNYRFFDFVKIGVPFTLVVMGITVWLVPILFPM